jgi:hypothetical protein
MPTITRVKKTILINGVATTVEMEIDPRERENLRRFVAADKVQSDMGFHLSRDSKASRQGRNTARDMCFAGTKACSQKQRLTRMRSREARKLLREQG